MNIEFITIIINTYITYLFFRKFTYSFTILIYGYVYNTLVKTFGHFIKRILIYITDNSKKFNFSQKNSILNNNTSKITINNTL